MAKQGRPTAFREEYVSIARKVCAMYGATDEHLAELFEVSVTTISNWKNAHPHFMEALKLGKSATDQQVEDALLSRALGCNIVEEKLDKDGLKHRLERELPPDPTSCIFWLKNRQPRRWRDVYDPSAGTLKINISIHDSEPESEETEMGQELIQ